MSSESSVSKILRDTIPEIQELIVQDMSDGCGAKFNVIVVTPVFEGKSLLDRQRMVNDALKEEMKIIHALTMKTWTPKQYEEKKAAGQI